MNPQRPNLPLVNTDKGKSPVFTGNPPVPTEQFPQIFFGKFHFPVLPINHPSSFRVLPEYPVTTQQKVLIDALWRAATPAAKLVAINALNMYFSTIQFPAYYAIYTGSKPGIYTSSFKVSTDYQWKVFTSFPDAFVFLSEKLKSTEFYIETQESSALSLRPFTQISHPVSSSPPQQYVSEKVLQEQEIQIKRLTESVQYWKNMPEANRKELSRISSIRLTERENFAYEKKQLLEELKRANNMILSYSTELMALSPPPWINDDIMPFEKMARHFALLPSVKERFLTELSDRIPEIVSTIVDLTDSSVTTRILDLQLSLTHHLLPSLPYIGISVRQYRQNPDHPTLVHPGVAPPRLCLLANVNWQNVPPEHYSFVSNLFFHGMILTLQFDYRDDIPAFFGPTIREKITEIRVNHYGGFIHCLIYSNFPSSCDTYYFPAKHQIYLYSSSLLNLQEYWPVSSNATFPVDPQYYSSFVDLVQPTPGWTLYHETSLIKLWVPDSMTQAKIPRPDSDDEVPMAVDSEGNSD